ncbi:MAG: hypothetical protein AAF829_13575 [Pseudomonadota bacterium]
MKSALFGTGVMTAFMLAGAALAEVRGNPADTFTMMDTDGDGSVTATEFTTYATSKGEESGEAELQFAVMAGDDGVLTIGELEAVMAVQEKADDWKASTKTESETTVTELVEEAAPGDDAS